MAKTKTNFTAEKTVRDIRRATIRNYSAEESIAKLCRKEGINSNVYCRGSHDFLKVGRK